MVTKKAGGTAETPKKVSGRFKNHRDEMAIV
jgi:hypothetical protein